MTVQEFFVTTENRIRRAGENVPDWRYQCLHVAVVGFRAVT